jgi:hypothetical protein
MEMSALSIRYHGDIVVYLYVVLSLLQLLLTGYLDVCKTLRLGSARDDEQALPVYIPIIKEYLMSTSINIRITLIRITLMSEVLGNMVVWLEIEYRNPGKTSTFGPYANTCADQARLRKRSYEIGDEHLENELSERMINRTLGESPTLDGLYGLSCRDDEGIVYLTIFVKEEVNASVAAKLLTPTHIRTRLSIAFKLRIGCKSFLLLAASWPRRLEAFGS